MKCFILPCRRAVWAPAGAVSSPCLLLPCSCFQGYFLRGFPRLHWWCRLRTDSPTSSQSKFHKGIGDKLCIPPPALPAARGMKIRGEGWSIPGLDSRDSPGTWHRDSDCLPEELPWRIYEGPHKITALDSHSRSVTNTPPWCTQVAFKFAKARAPTTPNTWVSHLKCWNLGENRNKNSMLAGKGRFQTWISPLPRGRLQSPLSSEMQKLITRIASTHIIIFVYLILWSCVTVRLC